MRQQFNFEEASASVTVTIDVLRRPKKSLPPGTSRDLTRVRALTEIVGNFIANHCTAAQPLPSVEAPDAKEAA